MRSEATKYNWDTDTVVRIAKAESGCNNQAIGDNYPIAGLLAPSCGAMQVRTLEGRPSCEELMDLETNILWSYWIYEARGNFTAWTMYTNNKYKEMDL